MKKAVIIGYIGKDAEVKEDKVTFNVGVSENFTNKDGEKQEKTTWFYCQGKFGKFAEYLKKGTQVYIRGDMSINVSEGNAFINIFNPEVQLLGKREKANEEK